MDTAAADAHYAAWMRENLRHAANHFGLTIISDPVYGWRLKSIGARVRTDHGEAWLRVVSQEPQWASGDHWTGALDANAITGIRKPHVLDMHEWSEGRRQRAEVMTLVPGQPCSPTDALRETPDLPDSWWAELHLTLAVLADVDTTRVHADQQKVTARIHERFGAGIDTTVTAWETAHADLHWNNLRCPEFALLDWEFWGRAPAGVDAATLYLFSLLVPDTAQLVHAAFAAKLETPTGCIAQLYVAARLLRRIDDGDFPELGEPIRTYMESILSG
jgi:hypothetical protein